MSIEKRKCAVRGDRFVEPCETLEQATDGYGAFSKAKGIVVWEYVNTTTGEKSRKFYGARTRKFSQGIVFNHCPFCGESISEPLLEPARSLPKAKGERGTTPPKSE